MADLNNISCFSPFPSVTCSVLPLFWHDARETQSTVSKYSHRKEKGIVGNSLIIYIVVGPCLFSHNHYISICMGWRIDANSNVAVAKVYKGSHTNTIYSRSYTSVYIHPVDIP